MSQTDFRIFYDHHEISRFWTYVSSVLQTGRLTNQAGYRSGFPPIKKCHNSSPTLFTFRWNSLFCSSPSHLLTGCTFDPSMWSFCIAFTQRALNLFMSDKNCQRSIMSNLIFWRLIFVLKLYARPTLTAKLLWKMQL